ncbi:major facilitator superfamily domain-containing protein [Irpex lacteus]|nr:major facilitator superfamily domain-containing protein [Irpex lacteus]
MATTQDSSSNSANQAVPPASSEDKLNSSASAVPSTTETGFEESSGKAAHPDIVKRDFFILPIPKYLRYDPESPTEFDVFTNVLFGVATTCMVANLYYCQPLLLKLSQAFNVNHDEVSRIPTLVQAGYAVGLVLIGPLGDLVRRRQLILLLMTICSALTIGLPITSNVVVFEVLSFLIGISTVVPQILIALTGDLAPPHKRGSALSIVFSGLLFGVLIARVIAGLIAEFASYRIVFWVALGWQASMLVLLYFKLPDYPAKNKGMTYWTILYSMAKFAVTEPVLIQANLINLASMACFTNFWVTLTFLLGGPLYHYSTLVIGLFGLIGMVGVAAAPLIGPLVDGMYPWAAALISTVASLAFYAIQLAGGVNIAAVVVVTVGIDLFRQMQQVALITSVFGLDAAARARMNAVMIISLFIGQIMGTAVGTKVFNADGWRPAAALSVGWQGFCLIVILLRGPHCKRYTWFGYEGGWSIRKPQVKKDDKEKQVEPETEMPAEKIQEDVVPRKGEDQEAGSAKRAEGEPADVV